MTTGVNRAQTLFAPGGEVNRGQMASFITRMLAHTVARPAGLTMQASAVSVPGSDAAGDEGSVSLVGVGA